MRISERNVDASEILNRIICIKCACKFHDEKMMQNCNVKFHEKVVMSLHRANHMSVF